MELDTQVPWTIDVSSHTRKALHAPQISRVTAMLVFAMRLVHIFFVRSGKQTAMKRSTQMKTTIHELIIFDVRYAQKYTRQPVTSKERMSTPIRLRTRCLLRIDTKMTTVSDRARAIRKTLTNMDRNSFANITRMVTMFPQMPVMTRMGRTT